MSISQVNPASNNSHVNKVQNMKMSKATKPLGDAKQESEWKSKELGYQVNPTKIGSFDGYCSNHRYAVI